MKRPLFSLFLLFVFISAFAQKNYPGEVLRFFYDKGKKMQMHKTEDYICVKFKKEISQTARNNILNTLQSITIMNADNAYGKYTILKSDKTEELSVIKTSLLADNNVEYTGSCFTYNDKVLHFTTNEIIVRFKGNLSPFDINNLNTILNTSVIEKVKEYDNVYLIKLNNKGEEGRDDVFDVCNKYSSTGLVEFAHPNFIRQGMLLGLNEPKLSDKKPKKPVKNKSSNFVPNDSLYPRMWHLKNTGNNVPGGVQGIPGCDINAELAWDITTGNPNVLLSIIDTGVDTLHPDLVANLCDRSLWYDAYDDDQKPYDEYYHGTGVTGISLAVGNNHIGTVGISYTSKIMPVRVFGPYPFAFTTDLILGKGLTWSWKHGAAVFNLSWGGGIPTPLISFSIQNAVHYGRNNKGCIVCAGSGNDDKDTILYPASMPEVMGIGGLSPCNERKSPFSCDNYDSVLTWGASYGQDISCVAPCVYIGTTQLGGSWCLCGNGTSDSGPIAAAVCCLVLTKNINLSGDSVRMVIERSARKVGNYSYNIPKRNGMWNVEMGYGRIDARAALDMTPAGPSLIYDQVPPIIKVYPPESRETITDITIQTDITDNQLVAFGSNAPRLYYYSTSQPNFFFINGYKTGNHYTFSIPAVQYGTKLYYYVAAQDTSPNFNFTTFPLGGSGVNPPGSISPVKRLFYQNTTSYDTALYSFDVPKRIASDRETTVVSILNNTSGKTILDVNCLINITHSFDADLTIDLISPSGTEVVLAGGLDSAGQNYTNTFFDDEASFAIDDTSFHAPYTGSFRPIYPLWMLDGETSTGIWQLKIIDNGLADGGSLNAWSLFFKYSTISDVVPIPAKFSLVKNYPNPFNPKTRIVFNVAYTANVKLKLFDIAGREIAVLLNETRSPKLEDFIDFNTSDPGFNGGKGLPSGVYFYSLYVNDNYLESKKMILVK